ncbi:MAG: helix-turn-helix transcriptional regulator [Methanosarcinales archaeon]|jgi:y4mF family transcriptional regulator|nr:helix-turn-helix transcriptional regulator [Methanosarcinales archaeon]
MSKELSSLSLYVKNERKKADLTQVELSKKAGVGLRFIRDLEQGKETLRMDKVNQVLAMFGGELGVVPLDREKWYS